MPIRPSTSVCSGMSVNVLRSHLHGDGAIASEKDWNTEQPNEAFLLHSTCSTLDVHLDVVTCQICTFTCTTAGVVDVAGVTGNEWITQPVCDSNDWVNFVMACASSCDASLTSWTVIDSFP